MAQLGAKWIQKGLDSPEITEDETMSLLYELGDVREVGEEYQQAQEAFEKLAAMDPDYRDVRDRLKAVSAQLS